MFESVEWTEQLWVYDVAQPSLLCALPLRRAHKMYRLVFYSPSVYFLDSFPPPLLLADDAAAARASIRPPQRSGESEHERVEKGAHACSEYSMKSVCESDLKRIDWGMTCLVCGEHVCVVNVKNLSAR